MSEIDEMPARGAPGETGRGSRSLAVIALLLALTAVAAAGYLVYRYEVQGALSEVRSELSEVRELRETVAQQRAELSAELSAELDERLAAVESRLDPSEPNEALGELRQSVESQLEEQRRATQALLDEQRRRMEQAVESVLAAVREAREVAPPTTREWKLAEAEYLLRIASHRVLMERDARGALALLEAADAILAEVDDFALLPVRRAVAEELVALRAVETADVRGAFVRLDALKAGIDALPLRLTEYMEARRPEPAAAEAAGETMWDRLMGRIAGLVRVRSHEGAELAPLLSPAEATQVELNLRLALERAQLALLRADAELYRASLGDALGLLERYVDSGAAATEEFRAELVALQSLELGGELPAVGDSLRLLQEVTRGEPRASEDLGNPPQ